MVILIVGLVSLFVVFMVVVIRGIVDWIDFFLFGFLRYVLVGVFFVLVLILWIKDIVVCDWWLMIGFGVMFYGFYFWFFSVVLNFMIVFYVVLIIILMLMIILVIGVLMRIE